MDFLSIKFVIFLLVTVIANYILPQRFRVWALLASSLLFYYLGAKQYFALLLVLCLVTYLFGLLLEKFKKNYVYALGVLCVLAALGYFKYFSFALELLDYLPGWDTGRKALEFSQLIAPLGISFMTFQAISYLGDIYYGKIHAEKNPGIVALQVCFFPNVTSGPIQKARNFIPQIKEKAVFDYDMVRHGLLLIAFGALQKFYISDKLAAVIYDMQDALMTEPGHGGFHYLFFAFAYGIFIYSNFNSYSDMAIGIARVLGIRFGENFKRPYLSKSIKEFWQRWHISLNSWFVDYVYIPLGGSRKGKFRYFLNIFIVFFLSGLWHGAAMHFIYWGCLNAFYQIAGSLTSKFRVKIYNILKLDPESAVAVGWKRFCVFYLIALSWVFFTIPDTMMGFQMIKGILLPSVNSLFDGWIFGYFETVFAAVSLLATIVIFAQIQTKREKGSFSKLLAEQAPIVRYGLYVAVVVLLMFGFFGTFTGTGNGGFVYGNF